MDNSTSFEFELFKTVIHKPALKESLLVFQLAAMYAFLLCRLLFGLDGTFEGMSVGRLNFVWQFLNLAKLCMTFCMRIIVSVTFISVQDEC